MLVSVTRAASHLIPHDNFSIKGQSEVRWTTYTENMDLGKCGSRSARSMLTHLPLFQPKIL